jgi:hypothetical protein
MIGPEHRLSLALHCFCLTLVACGGSSDDTGGAAASTTASATSEPGGTSGTSDATPTTGPLPTTGNDTDPTSVIPCEADGWTITPLADAGLSGALPALTADGAGTLHVVYASGYARRPKGGAWTAESIPEMLTLEPAIAVDAAGAVHVATAQFQQPLNYLERTPDAQWQPAVQLGADDSKSSGMLDIVVDGDQKVHIVDVEPGLVHWERGADKTWTSMKPVAEDMVFAPSLAIDDGALRLCLRSPPGIRCLWRPVGETWSETYQEATSVMIGDLALAVDWVGRQHILYIDDVTTTLEYINLKFLSLHGEPPSPVAAGVLDTGVSHSGGIRPWKFAVDADGAVHGLWSIALGGGPPALRHGRPTRTRTPGRSRRSPAPTSTARPWRSTPRASTWCTRPTRRSCTRARTADEGTLRACEGFT